jgi:hypothetical protein|tara:strand:- start:250 stop:597 length:348 start_codon:yes stop_codon:yes gene_type:complete
MRETILDTWKDADAKASRKHNVKHGIPIPKPPKNNKKKKVSTAPQKTTGRKKGWKYGDIEDTAGFNYMGRVPDPDAKKITTNTPLVRAWAPVKKQAEGGYVKKYAKGGGVRKVRT